MSSQFIWGLLFVGLLAMGCSAKPTVTPETIDSPLPTPGKSVNANSPLPSPPPGLPDWDAEPASGKAVLRGRIEKTSPNILLGELFLAEAVPTSNPDIDLLQLDEERSPRASINRGTGEFIFRNIEPGKYGLIVWEPMNSTPVNDPATGHTFFIEIRADQVADVGTLYIP
jgi:hypothetical protein